MGGYALFYFVRKNLSMALPGIEAELGYSKVDLGLLLTSASLTYGAGKFLNGTAADRSNARWFMATGLMLSALMNLAFGLSSGFFTFTLFWVANSWFQSMGWPPCARLLTSWYPRKTLGSWWGLWNASHQVGGAVIFILGGYLASSPEWGWRWVFFIPAGLALIGAGFVALTLRDRPETLGFPNPEEAIRLGIDEGTLDTEDEQTRGDRDTPAPELEGDEESTRSAEVSPAARERESLWEEIERYLLKNPLIWLIAGGNFCVYVVRIAMLDWAPSFLVEARGLELKEAGWLVAALEIAGICGGLLAGTLSDRVFSGRRSIVNAIFMLGLAGGIAALWLAPGQSGSGGITQVALIISLIGFLVYGPQMLTSVSAADATPRHCAATATGFNGLFGYLGAALSGVGSGWLAEHYGWNMTLCAYLCCALLGLVLFLFAIRLEEARRAKV